MKKKTDSNSDHGLLYLNRISTWIWFILLFKNRFAARLTISMNTLTERESKEKIHLADNAQKHFLTSAKFLPKFNSSSCNLFSLVLA